MKQISLEEEYSKESGVTPQDIAKLREWLLTQPHLPEKYITDLDLILAFHSCDCSTGLTKQVLDLNFTLRSLFNFFQDRAIDARVEQTASNLLATPLRKTTKEGYKLLYLRLLSPDIKRFDLGMVFKLIFIVLDILQYEEGTWPGIILIVDFDDFSLGHVAKIDIFNLQQFLCYLQDAVFVKLKGMHYINAPSFVDKVLMLMRPFMKKELMDMLHIHTKESTTMEKFIPTEALPKDAGGSDKSSSELKDEVLFKLREYKDYFEADKHRRVTESLRPGKPKTLTDIFGGMEGSFKKLDID